MSLPQAQVNNFRPIPSVLALKTRLRRREANHYCRNCNVGNYLEKMILTTFKSQFEINFHSPGYKILVTSLSELLQAKTKTSEIKKYILKSKQ